MYLSSGWWKLHQGRFGSIPGLYGEKEPIEASKYAEVCRAI